MTTTEALLSRTGSHSVTFPMYRLDDFKEEVYLYYSTEWRGQPVTVTMTATRNKQPVWKDNQQTGVRLSDWRIYPGQARYAATADKNGDLTDTPRSRLNEQLQPLVVEWLASEDYKVSEHEAYKRALAYAVRELRPWTHATKDVRAARSALLREKKLTIEDGRLLLQLFDAHDGYVRALEAVTGS